MANGNAFRENALVGDGREPWIVALDQYDLEPDPTRGWFSSGLFRIEAKDSDQAPHIRCKSLLEERDRTRHARAHILWG